MSQNISAHRTQRTLNCFKTSEPTFFVSYLTLDDAVNPVRRKMIIFHNNISATDGGFSPTVAMATRLGYDIVCYWGFDAEYVYLIERLTQAHDGNFLVYCGPTHLAKPPHIPKTSWKCQGWRTYEPRANFHTPTGDESFSHF